MNTSEQLAALESERVIHQLLHLDGSPGSNPNFNSPHATFNAPGNAFQMPALSPTSPISPSNPSGLLAIACLQNRWPQPTFSHHRTGQHFITTVCVAGKVFQGLRLTIEEATESAAQAALTKKEGTSKATPGSQVKTSESSKPSSCAESTNKTKTDSSRVHKKNLFIPLQVSLKIKEVINTSPTKTSKDTDTQEPKKFETQEPKKPQTQEPKKPQTQEPTKPETQEPIKTQTQEPTKAQETQEPTNTQETVKHEEKDTSTTTIPNANDLSKNDRTSMKGNAETSTGRKAKPILLAPSFFTQKENEKEKV
ncbi:Hypothetical predicted protein [Paramuricea clavata]|uniref:Uncharacterized protein n=1 Tax=Paramuricea clavata TaxID=317549 RepID=A0A7D9EID9_PARCT|nr:Hypothetical predicted protein [Paramuricea clavata]